MRFELDEEAREICFSLDCRAYHKEAIYGAALVFTGQAYVFLGTKKGARLEVTLQAKKSLSAGELERLAGEFHNELLNQTLRWMVSKHNKTVKNAIITQALYSAHAKADRDA